MIRILIALFLVSVAWGHDVGRIRTEPLPKVQAGMAEVKIATEKDLPGGPKAEGQPGDYILRNSRAVFVVSRPRPASGYARYGGRILDAVMPEKGSDMDFLGELFISATDAKGLPNLRTLRAERAEIVNPGGRGQTAVLRVFAVDDRFPIVDQTLNIPSAPIGMRVEIDYALAPDTHTLTVQMRAINTTDRAQTYAMNLGLVQGDGIETYIPPIGAMDHAFRTAGTKTMLGLVDSLKGPHNLMAGLGQKIGYGFYRVDGRLGEIMRAEQIFQANLATWSGIQPGESRTVAWALTLSNGSLEPILAAMGDDERGAKISGDAAPNARLYFTNKDTDALSNIVKADDRGAFSLTLKPGDYQVAAFAEGRAPIMVDVKVPTDRLRISMPPAANLRFQIGDEKSQAAPCTVTFERISGPIPNSERAKYGEQGPFGRFHRVWFSRTGNETIPVEPGRYLVTFSRGFEYEVDAAELAFEPGKTTERRTSLARSARMPGYLSGDFHIHAMPSPDSNDALEDKVLAYAGAGVSIMVATDHDVNTDYKPVVKRLGMENRIAAITGTEISPNNRLGHFNAYPQRYDPSEPNNGAIAWYDKNAGQIFADARKNFDGDVIVQINHPRGGSMGWFDWIGMHKETGEIGKPQEFSDNFDAIEVFNGMGGGLVQVMTDWFNFLNQGKRFLAMGNTDSHRAYNFEAGFPRTYIRFGHEDPRRVNEKNLVEALRSGDVIVCAGPMIDFSIAGARPGGTVPSGQKLPFTLTVRAASWIKVEQVKLIVNGREAWSSPVPQTDGPLDWTITAEIEPPTEGWIIADALGSRFTALYPSVKPRAFTNPIFVKPPR